MSRERRSREESTSPIGLVDSRLPFALLRRGERDFEGRLSELHTGKHEKYLLMTRVVIMTR